MDEKIDHPGIVELSRRPYTRTVTCRDCPDTFFLDDEEAVKHLLATGHKLSLHFAYMVEYGKGQPND